jgi:hypothetical protein
MIGKVIKYKFDTDTNLNSLFGGRVFPVGWGAGAGVAVCHL